MYDAIIIGGGPAGLSAALNFGRGQFKTLVIDDNNPRNQVTKESHGYLTQDGVTSEEFRQNAQKDLLKYNDVTTIDSRVTNVSKEKEYFIVTTNNEVYQSKQVLLATGLREFYPNIKNFESFYGQSIFYCPWCDGYELRDQKLAVMVDETSINHLVMLLSNWSKQLYIVTNGKKIINDEFKILLDKKGYDYNESVIKEVVGTNGHLESIVFEDGTKEDVEGMISSMIWDTDFEFLEELQPTRGEKNEIVVDQFGETSINGLYVAGETKANFARQLINAASDGADIAKFMMVKLIQESFLK